MDEFFKFLATDPNAKLAVPFLIWGIGILAVIFTILIIVGFFQGRSFKFWQIDLGAQPNSKIKKIPKKEFEAESFVLDLPSGSDDKLDNIIDELDTIVNAAVSAEAERFWRVLNLLQGIQVFDNSALLRLCDQGKSPNEIWKKESSQNARFFRDINNSLQIAMKAISHVTTGHDVGSLRRASIALIDKNNFLYIIARDHYSKSHEKEEKFYVGDTGSECGIAGYVAFTKKPIRIPDVTKEPKFTHFHNTPKYKSLLCVPILVEERILGTFSIDSTAEDAYTQEEEEMALIFANTIATSVIALMLRNALHSK